MEAASTPRIMSTNNKTYTRAEILERKRKDIDKHIHKFKAPLDKFVVESFSKNLWRRTSEVASVFPELDQSEHADICTSYPVVMTILTWIVWPFKTSTFVEHFLRAAQRSDAHLPFDENLEFLGPHAIQFRETQMMFKPCLIITDMMNVVSYPENQPLPFQDLERISQGTGGEICKVTIAPRYIAQGIYTNEHAEVLAYKKFHRAADLEIQNQAYLRASISEHPHVQLHLAAILHGEDLCIFLPWTPLGDLEVLIHGGHDPAAESTTLGTAKFEFSDKFGDVLEIHFVHQLYKLAHALEYLHHKLVLSNTSAEHFYCAHNDLRPRNILVYEDKHCPVGKWMIADFGISSFGPTSEDPEVMPRYFYHPTVGNLTQDKSRSPVQRLGTHFAPELHEMSPRRADPRKCDVWSFGCICSDVLAFVMGGHGHKSDVAIREAVRSLRAFRISKTADDDYFYKNPPGESKYDIRLADAQLRPEVDTWLKTLDTRARHSRSLTWVSDLTALIRDMLRIDPAQRIDACEVVARFEKLPRSMETRPRSPISPLATVGPDRRISKHLLSSSTSIETGTSGPSTVLESPRRVESPPQSPRGFPTFTSTGPDLTLRLDRSVAEDTAAESSQASLSGASRGKGRGSLSSGEHPSPPSRSSQTSATDASSPQNTAQKTDSVRESFVSKRRLISDQGIRCSAVSPNADKVAYLINDSQRLKRWYVKIFDTDGQSGGTSLPALPEHIRWNKWAHLKIASNHVTVSGLNKHQTRESFRMIIDEASPWYAESCSPNQPFREERSCDIVPSARGHYALISHNTIHIRNPNTSGSTLKFSRPNSTLWNHCFTADGSFFISWWTRTTNNTNNVIRHEICFWDIRRPKSTPDRYTFTAEARRNSEKWSLLPAASKAACVFSLDPSESYYYLEATWGRRSMRAITVPTTSLLNTLPAACEDNWVASIVPKPGGSLLGRLKREYEVHHAFFGMTEDGSFSIEDKQTLAQSLPDSAYHVVVRNLDDGTQMRKVVLADETGEVIVARLPGLPVPSGSLAERVASHSHDFATNGELGLDGLESSALTDRGIYGIPVGLE